MEWLYFLLLVAAYLTLGLLDAFNKIDLLRPLPQLLLLPLLLNLPLWVYGLNLNLAIPWRQPYLIVLGGLAAYLWLRLHFLPNRQPRPLSRRIRLMNGGRLIIYSALAGSLIEALVIIFLYPRLPVLPPRLLWINSLFAGLMLLALYLNGLLRIFFTSSRLGLARRLALLLTFWLPIINIWPLISACRRVYEEYDFACNKADLSLTRIECDLCQTRYPLVLVHGLMFRDLRYFNYWGRIPRELIRCGATIYYGNQEAVGSIATNAADLAATIARVRAETGSPKVNLLAHSKGGLDCRYAISSLGLADAVASLTTINTPHLGCRFVDLACHLPERLYRGICNAIDNFCRRLGDKNPDFYTASRQFATIASADFNAQNPDAPGVYYQSYTSQMGRATSDGLLALPYCLIKLLEGANDGLVAVNSARWGSFRELYLPGGRHGISHGDIIDLKRRDYSGFDVREAYLQLVHQLKELGY